MTEQEAYDAYIKSCRSVPGLSGFSFLEWRMMGRPVSPNPRDGYFKQEEKSCTTP